MAQPLARTQLALEDRRHAPNPRTASCPTRGSGPQRGPGDETALSHAAAPGSKRPRGVDESEDAHQPGRRLGRPPVSYHGGSKTHAERDAATEDTELMQLTQNEAMAGAPEETSPAVSPVDEMTDRLDDIADFSNLDEKNATRAPPCAFRPRPHRFEELRQEITHMSQKATQERAQLFSDCAKFDDYLHSVQHGSLSANHRRKVFEWNLAVRHLPPAPIRPSPCRASGLRAPAVTAVQFLTFARRPSVDG